MGGLALRATQQDVHSTAAFNMVNRNRVLINGSTNIGVLVGQHDLLASRVISQQKEGIQQWQLMPRRCLSNITAPPNEKKRLPVFSHRFF